METTVVYKYYKSGSFDSCAIQSLLKAYDSHVVIMHRKHWYPHFVWLFVSL